MTTQFRKKVVFGTILVFVLAVIVRVAFFTVLFDEIEQLSALGFSTDTFKFERLTEGLRESGNYGLADGGPSVGQPPLYVFILFVMRGLFGESDWPVRIFQAIIGSLTAVFCYLTARLFFKQLPAIVAGIVVAIFPDFVVYSALLLAETLFVFFLTVGVYLAARTWLDVKWGYAVLAGIAFGLAALTREVALLLPLVIAVVFLKRIGWKKSSVLIICAAAVIAPWTIRNAVVFKAFIPITARGGYALFQGTIDPGSGYNVSDYRNLREGESAHYRGHYRRVVNESKGIKDAIERDRVFRDYALNYLIRHPGKYLGYFPKKLVFYWQSHIGPEHVSRVGFGWAIFSVMIAYYIALFAGFSGGLRMKGLPAVLFWTVVGYFVVTHLLFSECEPRYHIPALVVFPYAITFGVYMVFNDITGKNIAILLSNE